MIVLLIMEWPMESKVQMNIRVPIDIRDWARNEAEKNHRSLASFITVVLENLMRADDSMQGKER